MTIYAAKIKGKRFTGSLAELSAIYCDRRDKSGQGKELFRTANVTTIDGEPVGYISYNGRIWAGTPQAWTTSTANLYTKKA